MINCTFCRPSWRRDQRTGVLTQHGQVDLCLEWRLGHDVARLATETRLVVGCLCRERVLVLGQTTRGSLGTRVSDKFLIAPSAFFRHCLPVRHPHLDSVLVPN